MSKQPLALKYPDEDIEKVFSRTYSLCVDALDDVEKQVDLAPRATLWLTEDAYEAILYFDTMVSLRPDWQLEPLRYQGRLIKAHGVWPR